MRKSDKFFLIGIMIFTIVLFAIVLVASLLSIDDKNKTCEQKGGVLVKAPSGVLCVDKRVTAQHGK
jgi:hypothetical protein